MTSLVFISSMRVACVEGWEDCCHRLHAADKRWLTLLNPGRPAGRVFAAGESEDYSSHNVHTATVRYAQIAERRDDDDEKTMS